MPWTEITRPKYRRDGLRYASDTTDEEWASIAPFMPAARPLGRPRRTDLRAVVNALFFVLSSGCQWRLLPRDFPPRSTVRNAGGLRSAHASTSGRLRRPQGA